jgi:uncharacterized protein YoxC
VSDHIHIHIHPDKDTAGRLYRIEKSLGEIVETLESIMATLADIQSTLATVDTALGVVKTDVETLLAKIAAIPAGGLTPEQQAAIDDIAQHVQGIATSLGAIDTEVNPPAPTPTP